MASTPGAMRVRKILALAVVALAEPIDRALIDRALLPIDRALLPNARDEHRRRCAQKCAAQGRAMIFALHTRKAGGSSIREYLARHVCSSSSWQRRHTFVVSVSSAPRVARDASAVAVLLVAASVSDAPTPPLSRAERGRCFRHPAARLAKRRPGAHAARACVPNPQLLSLIHI